MTEHLGMRRTFKQNFITSKRRFSIKNIIQQSLQTEEGLKEDICNVKKWTRECFPEYTKNFYSSTRKYHKPWWKKQAKPREGQFTEEEAERPIRDVNKQRNAIEKITYHLIIAKQAKASKRSFVILLVGWDTRKVSPAGEDTNRQSYSEGQAGRT